jgi:hypothetical protein
MRVAGPSKRAILHTLYILCIARVNDRLLRCNGNGSSVFQGVGSAWPGAGWRVALSYGEVTRASVSLRPPAGSRSLNNGTSVWYTFARSGISHTSTDTRS